jgi:hypothetical protein
VVFLESEEESDERGGGFAYEVRQADGVFELTPAVAVGDGGALLEHQVEDSVEEDHMLSPEEGVLEDLLQEGHQLEDLAAAAAIRERLPESADDLEAESQQIAPSSLPPARHPPQLALQHFQRRRLIFAPVTVDTYDEGSERLEKLARRLNLLAEAL